MWTADNRPRLQPRQTALSERPDRCGMGAYRAADPTGQAQQCQSAGLARRRPRPHRRDAAEPARRTPPVELARQPAARSGRIGRDLRLALPHRKCAATKLSPKYPAAFGGCLRLVGCLTLLFNSMSDSIACSRAPRVVSANTSVPRLPFATIGHFAFVLDRTAAGLPVGGAQG